MTDRRTGWGLNTLSPSLGSRRRARRVGRGCGSGYGKTAGRGHKGQKSRSGGSISPGFEGGQLPLQKRLPKFGFSSRIGRVSAQIRLGDLARIEGDLVDMQTLREAGLIRVGTRRVGIVLSGEVQRAMQVRGVRVTRGARAAVEAIGGSVED